MATSRGRPPKRKSPDDNEATDNIQINFSIIDQDGRHMYFKVNHNLELIKVFKDFCERKNLEYETMQFLCDGIHIKGKHTPKMLNMEDDAEIFAATHQVGGGGDMRC
ncbi:hypothetical protein AAZX31_08G109100 [Glycine max]|uniref:Ubiquitin-like domain-containing protein n=2 Tax=Glycine subgen. Soja TaxID=1462606 RepID=I1KS93_SOYBN|nr:uncharacterized protein LOC100306317 isoform X1 [Glycine max]XP_006584493.1 uncharacterized protein LOC100306317 isoform X1 [Glycine max]XP_028247256.1 small ubiquitin-related modifier 1-like [Glycine soja]XP_028247257.1 small ubiquitin-related modifier 1-like [Glycine soja]KAG5015376.1 hypothetical protein JHK85_021512 [Glycine max]KAG5025153.1 hypothetical protein JHK86_021067 [Glycine max]KAG5136326.1 hypothetical protein JHK82_021057 [Glycine max]KAH1050697.1 hypothetical protein GYH3|eukprot:XP_006584492.1 uncharacterized protein LOC100306317 isoform X1 [Glycine max]